MEEYIHIMEAARRVGVSDKTIRRAVKAGKLPVQRPKRNLALIAVSDLEKWYLLTNETLEQRIAALEVSFERRIVALENQVTDLTQALGVLSGNVERLREEQSRATPVAPPPETEVYLIDFADLHAVNRNEAEQRWKSGFLAGRKITVRDRAQIVIAARGQRDFFVQFHNQAGFRACDQCPHAVEST